MISLVVRMLLCGITSVTTVLSLNKTLICAHLHTPITGQHSLLMDGKFNVSLVTNYG